MQFKHKCLPRVVPVPVCRAHRVHTQTGRRAAASIIPRTIHTSHDPIEPKPYPGVHRPTYLGAETPHPHGRGGPQRGGGGRREGGEHCWPAGDRSGGLLERPAQGRLHQVTEGHGAALWAGRVGVDGMVGLAGWRVGAAEGRGSMIQPRPGHEGKGAGASCDRHTGLDPFFDRHAGVGWGRRAKPLSRRRARPLACSMPALA